MRFSSKFKKSFTLVELIISLSIGAILVLGTFNVLGQSLATIQETTVAGTMDNYAYSIQKRIRRELVTSKYLNVASIKNEFNVIDKTIVGNQGYNYKGIFYGNKDELNYGIVFNESENRVSVAYYPELNRYLPSSEQEFQELIVIFSEESSNGVKIEDFKWNIDEYSVTAENYNNPDYSESPTKMVRYQFSLTKNYGNGKSPLKKVYYFTEVLECAI